MNLTTTHWYNTSDCLPPLFETVLILVSYANTDEDYERAESEEVLSEFICESYLLDQNVPTCKSGLGWSFLSYQLPENFNLKRCDYKVIKWGRQTGEL